MRDGERDIRAGDRAQREVLASNVVVLAYAHPTSLLVDVSNAVVLAYAQPAAVLAIASNAVVLACATRSGRTYLVANESVHIWISGECVSVRVLCVSPPFLAYVSLSVCVCV